MVLTICRQNCAKFWASVLLATLHGYHEPLNSHPSRRMALAAPSFTSVWARTVKYWL